MPRGEHGKFPVSARQETRGRPLDWCGADDLWDANPLWVPVDPGTAAWVAVARVQWRVVQAVLGHRGQRRGAGAWLAGRVGAQPSQINSKLKGSDWLQPQDLLVWDRAVPGLALHGALTGVEDLPPAWASLRPASRDQPLRLVSDWPGVLERLGSWLDALQVPALAGEGGLRLDLPGGAGLAKIAPAKNTFYNTPPGHSWG